MMQLAYRMSDLMKFILVIVSVLPLLSAWLIMDPQPPGENAKRTNAYIPDQISVPDTGYRVGCLKESSFGRSIIKLYQRLLATPDPSTIPLAFTRPLSDLFWMDFLRILEREAQLSAQSEATDTKVILNFQPCSSLRLRHFVIG